MGDVIPFVKHGYTMNMDPGDGFTCMVCGHWVVYTSETEWGDLYACDPTHPKRFGHMHGRERFRFCPHCGAMVLTPKEWVDVYPQDQGKNVNEIARRHYEPKEDS